MIVLQLAMPPDWESDGIYADPTQTGPHMADDTATSVYRYYDENEMLLYVGITARGARRNFEHANYKEWWPFVVRQEVTHHDSRRAALAIEKALIQQFRPPFNTQHNPDYRETRALYLAYASTPRTTETANQMYKRLQHQVPLRFVKTCPDDPRGAIFRTEPEHAALMLKTEFGKQPRVVARGQGGSVKPLGAHGPIMIFSVHSKWFPFTVKHAHLVVSKAKPVEIEKYTVTVINISYDPSVPAEVPPKLARKRARQDERKARARAAARASSVSS